MNLLYCFQYIILTCRFLSDKITSRGVYNMLSKYIIYFNTLTNQGKLEQIAIWFVFFMLFIVICGFLLFFKLKFVEKNKNSLFQKFLKKL